MAKPSGKQGEQKTNEDGNRKRTYAENIELEKLEKELKELEGRKTEIAKAFEEANADALKLEELSREMNELQDTLDEKELRWLELSELGDF